MNIHDVVINIDGGLLGKSTIYKLYSIRTTCYTYTRDTAMRLPSNNQGYTSFFSERLSASFCVENSNFLDTLNFFPDKYGSLIPGNCGN